MEIRVLFHKHKLLVLALKVHAKLVTMDETKVIIRVVTVRELAARILLVLTLYEYAYPHLCSCSIFRLHLLVLRSGRLRQI